jgi:hypothetical protein
VHRCQELTALDIREALDLALAKEPDFINVSTIFSTFVLSKKLICSSISRSG